MKKITFWFITDILFVIIYIILRFMLYTPYLKSLNSGGGGDSSMHILIYIYYQLIVNLIFIIIQFFHSFCFFIFVNNKKNYLFQKNIIFFLYSIAIFGYHIYFNLQSANEINWIVYFSTIIIISNILYYFLIKGLGKKLKW